MTITEAYMCYRGELDVSIQFDTVLSTLIQNPAQINDLICSIDNLGTLFQVTTFYSFCSLVDSMIVRKTE